MGRIARIASWLVVLSSALFSIHVIAAFGATFWGFTLPVIVFGAIVGGVIPLAASLIATYNQRAAARIYLWIAPIATLLFLLFGRAFGGIILTTAIFSGAILVPLFFWRWAARRNWPPLLAASLSRRPRLAAGLGFGLMCVLLVVAFFWSLGLPYWDPISDCGGRPLLDERGIPYNIDFTARSGLGRRLLDFCPFQRVECGRTRPLDLAGVEVRMLRDGPPKFGARIIGHFYRGRVSQRPISGAELSIEGPSGTTVLTTDAQGIYDANGLPPGRYTVRSMRDEIIVDLKAGQIRNEDFYSR